VSTKNPIEDDSLQSGLHSVPASANYVERNITPFNVSHHGPVSQYVVSREIQMEPIHNNALRVNNVHVKVRNMQTSLFTGSPDEFNTFSAPVPTLTDDVISSLIFFLNVIPRGVNVL